MSAPTAHVTKTASSTALRPAAPPPTPQSFRRWAAATYGGPAALALTTASTPSPPAGAKDVLVRVLATDSTYTDLLILRGNYMPRFPTPVTPGYACVGEVESAGPGVTGPLGVAGTLVLAMPQRGCASEYAVLPAASCVAVPDARVAGALRRALAAAASLPLTGVTAYQMLHRAAGADRLGPTGALLVHGAAGGTGAMLVQLAKLAGVPPAAIVGTARGANLAAVRALGVTAVAYDGGVASWEAAARAASLAGFSAVFDAVGTAEYYAAGLRLLRAGGRYVAYGFTRSSTPGAFSLGEAATRLFVSFPLRAYLLRFIDGKEAGFYNVAERRAALPDEFAEDALALAGLLADGRLDVDVGKVWPFEAVPDALRAIEGGSHTGKQIIDVAGELAAARA